MTRKRTFYLVAGPLGAVLFAFAVSSIFLAISGSSPFTAFREMYQFGTSTDSLVSAVNRSIPLYFSAMAVALGFKMGLFNIGVEGQYTLAALLAAYVGAVVDLPAVIHVALIMAVAMAVGAAWSGIAGVLKVRRNIHEVISTIMLNAIATGLVAYLLLNYLAQTNPEGDLIIKTADIPASGQFPTLNPVLEFVGLNPSRELHGFLIIAIVVGVIYHLLVTRTRFGYELRASGINPGAAEAAGVDPGGMVIKAMVIGGAIAGLVGMSQLLGFFHRYTIDFPTGLGFTGIAAALLGRNHAVGMVFGAFLFGWFDRAAQILDLRDIPKEIVTIIQGILVLSVVISYALVSRRLQALEVQAAARGTITPEAASP